MTKTTIVVLVGVALVGGAIYLATRDEPARPAASATSGGNAWTQIISGAISIGSSLLHSRESSKTSAPYSTSSSPTPSIPTGTGTTVYA